MTRTYPVLAAIALMMPITIDAFAQQRPATVVICERSSSLHPIPGCDTPQTAGGSPSANSQGQASAVPMSKSSQRLQDLNSAVQQYQRYLKDRENMADEDVSSSSSNHRAIVSPQQSDVQQQQQENMRLQQAAEQKRRQLEALKAKQKDQQYRTSLSNPWAGSIDTKKSATINPFE